ncbi:MAG: efflux RND transporter periplasmic adaptor subunit [Alcanivoracaceae bacterium]|nr:efflux RND transporter periplasmic adaptor subunit [Alcanivoracaceae bacterium]
MWKIKIFKLFFLLQSFMRRLNKNNNSEKNYGLCRNNSVLGLNIILISLFLSFSSYAQFGAAAPVKVAQVQEIMMAPVRKVPAMVEAKFVAMIKAESRGIVKTLLEVGATVKEGDVIAVLTDTQAELKREELKGAVLGSEAKLNFLKSENTRLNDMMAKSLISHSELEQNKSDFISAKNDLVQARSRLEQFLDQIEKLTVKAPYDGIVIQQLSQPGQLLNEGDDVIEFMQANNLEVVVNIPFKFKSQIKANAIWQIETKNDTEGIKIINARIKRFIPAATGQSHTIEVHLAVDDDANNNDLWAGEAVNVLVPTQKRKEVIAVPRDALVIRKNGAFVYTVVEDKSHKVDVITGMAQGQLIEVKGLLSAGDSVIIRGNERLRNDQAVNIID